MTGNYKLKKIINGRGFYCEINLEVILIEELGVALDHDSKSVWFNPISFAVNYFYESYSIRRKGGFRVIIHNVNSQIVDTSNMVVFYVTLKALCSAFSVEEDLQMSLTEEGKFVFPKVLLIP